MISATFDLLYIDLQPEYEFSSSTRFEQFRKFGKNEVGGTVLPSHPYENKFYTGFEFYLCVRFDLPSSINFRDISGSPNWGPITLIGGSPQKVQNGTIGFYWYVFLLVINCTRCRMLHRFRDIAFDMSSVAIFGYPSCISPSSELFPGTIFVRFCTMDG